MWKRIRLTDEHIKGGKYSTLIFIGDRQYLKVTNKLVKRVDWETYMIYKDGFTFDLYRIEYGRFGKRIDVFDRKVTSDELATLFEEWIPDEDLPLPKVTGEPLEELIDE